MFDNVINTLKEPLDKYLLWEWHRLLKKGTVDEEIDNIGKWKKYENRLSKTNLKLCEPHLVENSIFNLLEDWNESNTVKYNNISIGEFQVHNNRQCYKFRFNFKNLIKILNLD